MAEIMRIYACKSSAEAKAHTASNRACFLGTGKLILLILLCIFVCGCASVIQYVPKIENQGDFSYCPVDKARIYVIRPATIWGAAMHYAVRDNGQDIGLTGPQSYLCWQRDPGQVHIWSRGFNEYTCNFYAAAGQMYYLLQYVDTMNGEYGGISLISREEALKYLKSCHPAK